MTKLATYELDGRIATIAMDDGKVNALSIEMLEAVLAAFDRAEATRRWSSSPAARSTSRPDSTSRSSPSGPRK